MFHVKHHFRHYVASAPKLFGRVTGDSLVDIGNNVALWFPVNILNVDINYEGAS